MARRKGISKKQAQQLLLVLFGFCRGDLSKLSSAMAPTTLPKAAVTPTYVAPTLPSPTQTLILPSQQEVIQQIKPDTAYIPSIGFIPLPTLQPHQVEREEREEP